MKDEASVNNMRENYFSISSMLRENYKIEWSCYLRWGREVLCEVSRTSYKTWCTNVWHCHQISMGRLTSVSPQSLSQDHKSLHDHSEGVSSSTLAITRVESGVCSLSPSLQHWGWEWVPVPGRPRLLAFSPSTRARLISPGRCRDTFWSESGDFWERSPGSARSSDLPWAAPGTTRKRELGACCQEYLYEWWSHFIISTILERFCFSANDGWSPWRSLTRQHKIYFKMCCKWLPRHSDPEIQLPRIHFIACATIYLNSGQTFLHPDWGHKG